MICSRHCSKEISCLDLPLVAVKAMPTKHFSAWRLNKGEQASVDSDLATWEAALPLDLSEEEKTTLREDERKRLIRLVQQKKHDASLQKQCAAGAKTKSNANAKGAEKAAAKHVSDASSPGDGCGSNQEYYSQARLGSYLESFELRPEGDAAHTHCRHGARHDWHPGRLVFLVIHIFNLCAGSLIEDPFDLQKAKVALESHGSYISSCNLYWLDMWKTLHRVFRLLVNALRHWPTFTTQRTATTFSTSCWKSKWTCPHGQAAWFGRHLPTGDHPRHCPQGRAGTWSRWCHGLLQRFLETSIAPRRTLRPFVSFHCHLLLLLIVAFMGQRQ
jgi:hypothetical protein